MIEIKGLKKQFDGNLIFENVDLTVEKGDAIVIIGGSGCGKSTLLRCINKLIEPDAGEIIFGGQNILSKDVDIDKYRKRVGMVYQQFNLFSHLNVLENMILAPMTIDHVSRDDAIKEAMELLKTVGLENRALLMPSELSGGQKQRVAIARTLQMHPDVILFDEPTSALDPTMVEEVETVIRRLINKGMTSIIVTHEMSFAKNIASKVVFLADKTIYEQGSAKEVFNNPKRELTRQFLYRSRLFEEEVLAENIDCYELQTKLRTFATTYGLSKKQSLGIEYLCEEILMPVLKTSKIANVLMGCDITGASHTIYFEFPNYDNDPLKSNDFDELGFTLAKNFTSSLVSDKNGDGNWEIVATLNG